MRVLYVPLDMTSAERAVWTWLTEQPDIACVRANAGDAARMAKLTRADAVWIDAAFPVSMVPPGLAELADAAGPGWLLTNGAVTLPHRLGIEPHAPDVHIDRTWHDAEDELFLFDTFSEAPRLRGHAAFRRHCLFRGLGSGAYTWWPEEGEPYRSVMYERPDGPAHGRVIAVERGFIHINEKRATIWSYDAPRPILCIGAHLPFETRDTLFTQIRDRLARNALDWTAGKLRAPGDLHWNESQPGTLRIESADGQMTRDEDAEQGGAPAVSRPTGVPDDSAFSPLPLQLATQRLTARGNAPFTLAGRRAMIAGRVGGPREAWVHPLRIMQIERSSGDDASAVVSTLGIEERLPRGDTMVSERVAVVHDRPAFVVEWDSGPVTLEWRTDLRLMWPYPAGALGSLEWQSSPRSLVIRGALTGEQVLFEASRDVEWTVTDATADGAPALQCRLIMNESGPLRLIATVTVLDDDRVLDSPPRTGPHYHAVPPTDRPDGGDASRSTRNRQTSRAGGSDVIRSRPSDHVRAHAARLRRLANDRLQVDTPEPEIGTAIEWAKVRLDSYLVDTPGVGRSLVAGYWTSRPGWNDARPGYAWYFGRDAVWTAFASLAVGDFDAVRDTIAFLGAHQDLSGKILHECTTSGSVHYDSADSTPLYLLLVARFLAWTGDGEFVRSQLPCVQAALSFCISTDTDGDNLIENTRVGHGWIEFGRLGGGKVTYYNAGIWVAALREIGTAFEDIGEHALSHQTRDLARDARTAMERLFYSTARRAYALKAWNPVATEAASDAIPAAPAAASGSDGLPASADSVQTPQSESIRLGALEWLRDFTPTATHAVPMLLGVADADRARSWLDAVASSDFSTEWGVRMISRAEPGFDPASYHGGAVWPLYTGWVAWAEYVAGRTESAFRHWRANALLGFENQPGAWDEVLHGTERRAVGVCPDQAWSTAMAVSPFVYGLLGAEADATRGRLRLRPRIPRQWDRLDIRNLRMGESSVALGYRRHGTTHVFTISQDEGAVPLRIIFEPALPIGALQAIRIDGIEARLDARPIGDRLQISAQVMLDHNRTIEIVGEPSNP